MENWKLVFRAEFSERSIAPSLCYLAPETVPLPGSPLVGPLCCSWWASMVPHRPSLSSGGTKMATLGLPPILDENGLPRALQSGLGTSPSLTGWVGSWGSRQGLPSQLCPGAGVAVHGPGVQGRGWVVRSMKGLGILQGLVGLQWERSELRALMGLTLCPWKRRKMLFCTENKWVTDSSHWDPWH